VIPNLDVIRPGDAEEVAGAFSAALSRSDGPTALILSRQNIQTESKLTAKERRSGVQHGGYIAHKETTDLQLILLATGSELPIAIKAARELGPFVRVVSMPCFERFERQSTEYKERILPNACRSRIAIEAGVSNTWGTYLGLDGKAVCIDRFGLSAPGNTAMNELGISLENLKSIASDLVKS
jgi:transketolase